jgi:[protein-PII] uridylyltransferase
MIMTNKPAKSKESSLEINNINDLFDIQLKELKERFLQTEDIYNAGFEFQYKYTDLIDKTIRELAAFSFIEAEAGQPPALIALGGYGRKELSPYSDIDLVFVQEQPFSKQARKLIESLTSHFWNAGLKISASARTLKECEEAMGEDISFLTSLLEKRLVWGPKPIFTKLERAYQEHIRKTPPGYFVTAKLDERDLRHHKMGDSRYQLEPNIKESKGALRDIHTLLWITNFLYGISRAEDLVNEDILTSEEAKTLWRAQHFFWTVRCHLHFIAGRANDRLSFDSQPLIAGLMGYTDNEPNVRAEKFMKHYFLLAREVGHLTRVLCAKIEAQSLKAQKLVLEEAVEGFPVKSNRLTITNPNVFRKFSSEIIRLFRVSQTSGIDIHPDALRHMHDALGSLKKHSEEAYPLFLEILLDGNAEPILRRMNEADVLGALIPEFKNIVAHMQYDMYHSFTADEHTIHAIGLLHQLEAGDLAATAALASDLFAKIHSRRALYAAMFLHDIAKGTGPGAKAPHINLAREARGHSETGAEAAQEICPLLGLMPEETETVAWLIEHHLDMTMTAFKRDLDDEKTIDDFVAIVQSPERLKLLTILTTADIMAVGPERWNHWKSGLLTELYHKSMAVMSDVTHPLPERGEINSASLTPPLPLGEGRGEGAPHINIAQHPEEDHTEVTVTTPDRPGLFSLLSGAIAASGASIVAARIFTLSNGMAQDVFQIQSLKGTVYENTSYLNKTIKGALGGKLDLVAEIREKQKTAPKKSELFKHPPRVIVDNDASASNTVIEVNGNDRPGFLYAITSALTAQGLQISAAKIATFGSRAVDVFYIRDNFGLKIVHPDKLRAIENSLMEALEGSL